MSTVPHTLEPVHFSPQTIYCGDCLEILAQFPANSVDLIYIDPPFNSNRNYEVFWGDTQEKRAFDDRYGDALAYCEYMRPRIEHLHRVLKTTGSFYYHCDWHASHYIKVMLDEIFGFNNFQSEIVWKRQTAHSDSGTFAKLHDSIFFYSRSGSHMFNTQYMEYTDKHISENYRYSDERGVFALGQLKAPGNRGPKYTWNGIERHWRYTEANMQQLHDEGRLYYGKSGIPWKKLYLTDMPGVVCGTVWTDINPVHSQAKERLGYPTQKPLALLERIIKASSNPGDIVLDAFCGCGTALVAAQQLGRRWLGIDISPTSCNVMGRRLEDVCGMKLAPPSMGVREVEDSWNAMQIPASVGVTPASGQGRDAPATRTDGGKDAAATGGRKDGGKLPPPQGGVDTKGQSYYRFSNLPRSAEQLRKLPGFEFENWAVLQLGEVLRHQGHRIFAQTNRSKVGDLGLDGRIYLAERTSLPRKGGDLPLMEATGAGSGEKQKYLPIQVKNTDKVGRPEIDKFQTALRRDKRPAGFFIGWEFSSDALKEVERIKKIDDPLYIIPVRVQTLITEEFDVELMVLRGM